MEMVPVETTLEDSALDYALLRGTIGKPMMLLCREMKRGRTYYGIGYAGGRYRMDSRLFAERRTEAEVEGTSYSGMMRFGGGAIPGMSGGPIIDGKTRVVPSALRPCDQPVDTAELRLQFGTQHRAWAPGEGHQAMPLMLLRCWREG